MIHGIYISSLSNSVQYAILSSKESKFDIVYNLLHFATTMSYIVNHF